VIRRPRAAALMLVVAQALLLGGGCKFLAATPPPEQPVYASLAPPVLSLGEKAARYEVAYKAHNRTPEGLADYRRPKEPRPPEEPRYGRHADGPFHTGISLGAFSLKYAAKRDRSVLADVGKALEGLELLEAVTGRPGLFARYASRDPAPFDPKVMHPENGARAAPPLDAYVWRGDVSKDQYAGVAFGLATCLAHVDEPALRARAAKLARRIAAMLEETGERVVTASGEETTFGDLAARYGPIRIALHAAIVLSIVKSAAVPDVPGGERAAAYHKVLRERGWTRIVRSGIFNMSFFTIRNHVNDNMSFLTLYALLALERDPRVREDYLRGLEGAWDDVAHEGTPFFDLVYAACGGARAEEAGRLGRERLRQFPDEKRELPIDLTRHPELGLGRRWLNSRKGVARADRPLPLYLRGAGTMMWVRDPDLLWNDIGTGDTDHISPLDYLGAYWLGRAHGLIAFED